MPTEHAIPTGDGSVAAVHHPADGDRWVVFCHGFLSDKSGSYAGRCARAVEAGYDAVRFDFRGSGDSDLRFREATLSTRIADLRAVIEHFDPPAYALFGSSFGAKVAFHAADDLDPAAILARAPVTYNRAFESYRDTVESEGQLRFEDGRLIDDRFFEDFEAYPFEPAAAAIEAPVAIFHGDADGSVPLSDSLDAAAAFAGDVLLEKYAGEGHRFSEAAESRLRDRAFEWLGSTW